MHFIGIPPRLLTHYKPLECHPHALGEGLLQKICWWGQIYPVTETPRILIHYLTLHPDVNSSLKVQLVSLFRIYGGSLSSHPGRVCHFLEFSSFGFLYVVTSLMCF